MSRQYILTHVWHISSDILAVGHRVDGKRHVIAEFMRLAGGQLDAGAGGDSGDHDLGNAEALEMLLEARACECAPGSLGDRVILRLAVELGDEFRPIGGKRSEIRRLSVRPGAKRSTLTRTTESPL